MFIITGASDGLGLELARQLANEGKIVVSLSRSQPRLNEVSWVQTDLMDVDSIEKAATNLLGRFEPIEAFINCAGVVSHEPTNKLSVEELERVFKTNVTGPMILTSRLLDRIKQDGGDIVNIGSTIALKAGYDEQSVYSTTKWALRGFSQNLQAELLGTDCRVVDFLLGGFKSNLHQKNTGKPLADPENWMSPKDIASCLVHLLALPKNMEVSEIVLNRKVKK